MNPTQATATGERADLLAPLGERRYSCATPSAT